LFVLATVAEALTLGVRVKMLTGDAVAIAKETCKMLNLGTNVYDSQRLIGSGMAGSDIYDFVEEADGFAEVFPEHKYQVVEILQRRGHLTAMTGDGVNDAPSLKKADCGIAVEGASDAARSAADVVFLDPGLSTIITSIKVARQIFHRMKAYIGEQCTRRFPVERELTWNLKYTVSPSVCTSRFTLCCP
jgi:H+-transporting ATPase